MAPKKKYKSGNKPGSSADHAKLNEDEDEGGDDTTQIFAFTAANGRVKAQTFTTSSFNQTDVHKPKARNYGNKSDSELAGDVASKRMIIEDKKRNQPKPTRTPVDKLQAARAAASRAKEREEAQRQKKEEQKQKKDKQKALVAKEREEKKWANMEREKVVLLAKRLQFDLNRRNVIIQELEAGLARYEEMDCRGMQGTIERLRAERESAVGMLKDARREIAPLKKELKTARSETDESAASVSDANAKADRLERELKRCRDDIKLKLSEAISTTKEKVQDRYEQKLEKLEKKLERTDQLLQEKEDKNTELRARAKAAEKDVSLLQQKLADAQWSPPPRKRDASPPPRKRDASPPPRKRDASPPPRKRDASPPPRKRDASPPPRKQDRDRSPPRKRERDRSPSPSDISPEEEAEEQSLSRALELSYEDAAARRRKEGKRPLHARPPPRERARSPSPSPTPDASDDEESLHKIVEKDKRGEDDDPEERNVRFMDNQSSLSGF